MRLAASILLYVSIFASAASAADSRRKIVHTEPSAFGIIYVVDEGDERHLRFGSPDGIDQTVISLTDPDEVPVEYVRDAFIVLALVPRVDRLLMIGLGGGAVTTRLRRAGHPMAIDVAEVSPEVASVAKRFFGVREDERLRIHIADGRKFVAQAPPARYDVIFIDAYGGDDIPEHLATSEFFREVAGKLTPRGVVMMNVAVAGPVLEQRIATELGEAFTTVACLRTPRDDNLLLFGARHELPARDVVLRRAKEVQRTLKLGWPLDTAVARLELPCRRLTAP